MDAVQAIIDRGGYVVRIGNQGMTPIPHTEGFIDYANSNVKSDWLDIYLIGGARFLLGSVSGPNEIARLFGVPVANANSVPMSQGLLGANDIRIPKLLATVSPPKVLTFNEILNSVVLRDLHTRPQFIDANVTWQDNSADDIRELAVEMMEKLDGIAEYEATDSDLQRSFMELIYSQETPETFGTLSRIGRNFLRKNAYLLRGQNR
jgi:putative glycosyltransferase (TIGR04372 family)